MRRWRCALHGSEWPTDRAHGRTFQGTPFGSAEGARGHVTEERFVLNAVGCPLAPDRGKGSIPRRGAVGVCCAGEAQGPDFPAYPPPCACTALSKQRGWALNRCFGLISGTAAVLAQGGGGYPGREGEQHQCFSCLQASGGDRWQRLYSTSGTWSGTVLLCPLHCRKAPSAGGTGFCLCSALHLTRCSALRPAFVVPCLSRRPCVGFGLGFGFWFWVLDQNEMGNSKMPPKRRKNFHCPPPPLSRTPPRPRRVGWCLELNYIPPLGRCWRGVWEGVGLLERPNGAVYTARRRAMACSAPAPGCAAPTDIPRRPGPRTPHLAVQCGPLRFGATRPCSAVQWSRRRSEMRDWAEMGCTAEGPHFLTL